MDRPPRPSPPLHLRRDVAAHRHPRHRSSIVRTPKDIFPDIDIPVISVIWTYNGLSAQDFEQRITIYSEFALSSNVNDIERIESQTIDGVGIIRLHFHPGVKISDSLAQATAVSQAILRRMPPGVQPPIILRYTAASVPIVQMSLASDKMSEADLYDYGIFRIRTQIAVVNGITLPTPYGGTVRTVMVDLDPQALQAKGPQPARCERGDQPAEPRAAERPRAHRRHGLPRQSQQQPRGRRSPQRHPDQDRERRADLRARRGARARRLRHADERRPHRMACAARCSPSCATATPRRSTS